MKRKLMSVLELPWLTEPKHERSCCSIAVAIVHLCTGRVQLEAAQRALIVAMIGGNLAHRSCVVLTTFLRVNWQTFVAISVRWRLSCMNIVAIR